MRILSPRRFWVSSIRGLFLINRLRPTVRVHCGIHTVRIAGKWLRWPALSPSFRLQRVCLDRGQIVPSRRQNTRAHRFTHPRTWAHLKSESNSSALPDLRRERSRQPTYLDHTNSAAEASRDWNSIVSASHAPPDPWLDVVRDKLDVAIGESSVDTSRVFAAWSHKKLARRKAMPKMAMGCVGSLEVAIRCSRR